MNKEALEKIYGFINQQTDLKYDLENSTLDTLEIAKKELFKVGLNYKSKVYRGRERLLIYDHENFVMEYVRSFFPNNDKIAFKITNDKFLSEKFLKYSKVNTTTSKLFNKSEKDKARQHIKNSTENMVIKPLNLNGGTGVFLNINSKNFDIFWDECIAIQEKKKIEKPQIIVQNQIKGFEVRIVYTDGKFSTAIMRIPVHIMGDGKHNVKELIEIKNLERKKNPHFAKYPIKINNTLVKILKNTQHTLEDILPSGELLVLYPTSNVITGGESYEITEFLHPNILQQAKKATLAIPGLHTSGVDIIIDGFEAEEGTVIEINKAPSFLMSYYPKTGKRTRPLYDIFKTLQVEHHLLNNSSKLHEEDFSIIKSRYKYLYEKEKYTNKIINQLLVENQKLKQEIEAN